MFRSPAPQVINFTMPGTVKHYVHRVGRTARAGRSGRSVSLVGESERKMLKEVVKSARSTVKARVLPPGKQSQTEQVAQVRSVLQVREPITEMYICVIQKSS